MSKKSKLGWILLGGASLAAMSAIAPAYAQDDEIVVTATGRAAAIQDVPVAVTAIPGETIRDAGVENLLDIQQLAPSLRIGTGQSTSLGTIARIRALGTGGDNPGFESAVGFFIDGVYRARAGIAISDLPQVDRIEVLRGPQGTLFGRNTSSGAISVTTTGPDFDPAMWLEAGLGDLDYGAMRAGFNVPFNDNIAVRLDGSVRTRDGYMTDYTTGRDLNNQDRYSVRGQILFDISENASLRIIADRSETDEECCTATMLRYGSTQAILDSTYLLNPALAAYAPFMPSFGGATATLPNTGGVVRSPESRFASVSPNRNFLEQVNDEGISAQLDWDMGGINLTSITAYRRWEALRNQDIDYNIVDLFYREGLTVDIDNFTQEFRLQGESGRLNWLVGVFYSRESLDTTDRIRFGDSSAAYANATAIGQTAALLGAPRELFDLTSAPVDAFLGGDPVPSLLGLLNPALNQVYLTPNTSGQGQQADTWHQEAEDIAFFTHNELSLTDQLILTVGLRYSQSNKEMSGVLDAASNSCASMQALEAGFGVFSGLNTAANAGNSTAIAARTLLALVCAPQGNTAANRTAANPWTAERDENEYSGTLSLRYHMTDDLMFYGGYSRGYKAGGFNLDRSAFTGLFPGMTATQANTLLSGNQLGFEPEFTDSYELGMRSTILNGTTFFNVTVFHTVLSDYQLNAFNGTAFITRNIPEAISQGVEIDIMARLTPNLMIQGGINYTDAYNNSTVAFVPNSPADTIVSGTPLIQAPEWSVTGAITWDVPVTESIGARFYLDARYDTEHQTQALGRNPISDMGDTVTLNGRVALGDINERWSIELWGRNLTDELIYAGFNAPLQSGTVGAYTNEPRTWGVTLRARH